MFVGTFIRPMLKTWSILARQQFAHEQPEVEIASFNRKECLFAGIDAGRHMFHQSFICGDASVPKIAPAEGTPKPFEFRLQLPQNGAML